MWAANACLDFSSLAYWRPIGFTAVMLVTLGTLSLLRSIFWIVRFEP